MENTSWKLYAVHTDKIIAGFFGDYRFLSNYHPCEVWYQGFLYPSTENAFQAAKIIPSERGMFVHCSPGESKKIWKEPRFPKLYTPEQWESVKYDVMLQVNLQKFLLNPDLKAKLLATGSSYLEERNHWGDQVWGTNENGFGRNMLGKTLTLVRDAVDGLDKYKLSK